VILKDDEANTPSIEVAVVFTSADTGSDSTVESNQPTDPYILETCPPPPLEDSLAPTGPRTVNPRLGYRKTRLIDISIETLSAYQRNLELICRLNRRMTVNLSVGKPCLSWEGYAANFQ
jgi:hypothetical protein